jgi:5-methylcytosine-specific restriction endonuclease McrA
MVESLRRRHAQLGRAFTIEEFNAWRGRPFNAVLCVVRFGGWRRAMKAAGIEGVRGHRYSPAELIENLEAAWRKQGRRPGSSTFGLYSPIGIGPYVRVWGSLSRACELFAKHKAGLLSRRALLCPSGQPGRKRRLTPGLRWKVLEAAGHRCCSCGRSAKEKGVRLEVDHIVPVAEGGGDEISNLRVLCRECNRGRGRGGSSKRNVKSENRESEI